ncbi:MAG: FKBP-type peptidyl-prolyl cis-trans isomerase 2 [Candidatus Azotimanducaceae bacterium]|jgi:FKBP-type peptidyl-prolyl cis-trans isomerase 2
MAKATTDNTVKVHYTGKLNSGEIFDSSLEREPLEFTIGAGQMIPGFDAAVNGMEINEKKSITIPAEEAYGPRKEEMMQKVTKDQLPEDMKPEIGQTLVAGSPDGQEMHVIITEINDDNIVVDANHPLAGQELQFDIELVECK